MANRKNYWKSVTSQRETLYGFHPVMEALQAGRRKMYALMVDRVTLSDRQAKVVELAQQHHIPWQATTSEQICTACGSDQHQGIAASVSPLPIDSMDAILAAAGPTLEDCLLVLLDGIVDPNNLGAIVRTAHCVGALGLVTPRDRAVGPTPAVSKTSAGALEHTRFCRVTNLAGSIQRLKRRGVWVAGLAMEADQTVFQADLRGPLALVVGGEERGMRRLIRQYCDFLISIPLKGRIDSLNASNAAAVAFYEAFRQRQVPVSP